MVELAVLAVPVTALFSIAAPAMIVQAFASLSIFSVLPFVLGAAVLAFWSLVGIYWFEGPSGLQKAPRILWATCGIGALYPVVVGGAALVDLAQGTDAPLLRRLFSIYASGVPLLAPFIHLAGIAFNRRAEQKRAPGA
jgi:hypothetical protein